MNSQRLAVVLSLINFVLLVIIFWSHRVSPLADNVVPLVRCRALQVVDEQGRPRAGIQVLPAGVFGPTGKEYPETVILRLIDAAGRPEVKIVASKQGGAVGLVGENDETQLRLEAQGDESLLYLKHKNGKKQEMKP